MPDPSPQPALGRPARSPWARRLLMPVAILAVAAIIIFITRVREAARTVEIRQTIERLCLEIDQHRDDPEPSIPADLLPVLGPLLPDAIAAALPAGPLHANDLLIDITPGDLPPPRGDGRATHVADISVRGRVVLTLRVLDLGDPEGIRLLGTSVPEAGAAAPAPSP